MRFAVRPSRQPGASPRSHRMPCGDVPGRVHISVERGGAGEAGEDRLALAVARRDIPTPAASLRGVRGGDFLDSARSLGFQAPDQQAPAGPHDLPVQPGLGGDVSARLADGPLRRPGRALDPQVLNTDDVELAGQISGDLLTPVLPRVSLPGLQPGDRASGDLAVPRSRLRPGQPALHRTSRRCRPGLSRGTCSNSPVDRAALTATPRSTPTTSPVPGTGNGEGRAAVQAKAPDGSGTCENTSEYH